MKQNARRKKSTCPVTFALDIFGDKWSLLILRDMFFKGKKYYNEFLNSPEKISTNILASRLTKLELEGLITKNIDPENASKKIYRLSGKGKALLPMLLEMIAWSAAYDPMLDEAGTLVDGAPEELLARLSSNRSSLIAEILESLD